MISSANEIQGQLGQQTTTGDAFQEVDLQDFIKLLVTELQNQDPTDPVDSSEILQQVSQIKAIESNQRLSDTLTSLRLQQDLLAASALLERNIVGLTEDGDKVTGQVDRVSIEDENVKLYLGENVVQLKNVAEILTE